MKLHEVEETIRNAGHCSALVKVDGALADLFMGHSSWFEYANTDRIFKHYHFAFKARAADSGGPGGPTGPLGTPPRTTWMLSR